MFHMCYLSRSMMMGSSAHLESDDDGHNEVKREHTLMSSGGSKNERGIFALALNIPSVYMVSRQIFDD